MIADALIAGAHADAIFFSNYQLLATFPLKQHPSVELYQVGYEKIQLWSDVTTSPGVMGKIIVLQDVISNLTLCCCLHTKVSLTLQSHWNQNI